MSAPKTSSEMLTDLRAMLIDEAPQSVRLRALELAYQIGKTEGYYNGKREGIEEMHAAARKAMQL